MKELLNNLKTIYKEAIAAGDVSAKSVEKGLHDDPTQIQISRYPYICIDDAGERTEEAESAEGQWHIYSVVFEFANYKTNLESAIDGLLELSNEIKTELEKKTYRDSGKFKDDFIWGINITPYAWEEDSRFYRGRSVIIDFRKFESTYLRY